MAIVTSAEQLAGPHLSIYEEYWQLADSRSAGSLSASDAANFLKKSGLSDVILSKIWELSDSGGKGYLDKQGFFCALKLISLVQGGQEASLGNLASSTGSPNLGPTIGKSTMAGDWRLTAHEKSKYDGIFQNLQPAGGKLPGDKVRPVLMNSGLPVEILGKIWELSDHDKDGQLDCEEFAVAMHLVYQSIEKKPLPSTLPADLIPPSHKTAASHVPIGGIQVLPPLTALNTGSSVSSETPSAAPMTPAWNSPPASVNEINHDVAVELVSALTSTRFHVKVIFQLLAIVNTRHYGRAASWIVSPQFLLTSDQRFNHLDIDRDGLVNGTEIRDVLLQSGLDQQTLASIWTLCDMKSNGFLNREQFALAQWLIEDKVSRGRDPPASLSSEMIPPSLRGLSDPTKHGSTEVSADLLQIEAEIEEIKRKKIHLEGEKQQRDADLRISSGEVQTLQKEYEAISSTTQQLERQRGEAQKKLDELEDQKSRFDSEVGELRDKCAGKQQEIHDIKLQLTQQDRMEQDQAQELNRLKGEYADLHTEANRLEKQIESNHHAFEHLKLDKTRLNDEVSQSKTYVDELTKLNEHIEEAMKQYQSLINNEEGVTEPDMSTLQEPTLRLTQLATSSSNRSSPISYSNNTAPSRATPDMNSDFASFDIFGGSNKSADDPFAFSNSESKSDPFAASDPFSSTSAFDSNAFGKADPFTKDDPFKSDPFSSSDPFKDSAPGGDAFGLADSFKSSAASSVPKSSAVQMLQADALSRPKSTDPFTSSDPFASSTPPVRSASALPSNFTANDSADIFDPFKPSNDNATNSSDPFGFDPFASNKADEGKKKPPPRPALPRPKAASPTEPTTKPLFNADPFKMSSSTQPSRKGSRAKMPTPNEDPFGDPFGGSDPFGGTTNGTASKSADPFAANFADFGSSFDGAKEGDMAWAKAESEKAEAKRKRRLAEQEQADFELALALSKAES